MHARGLEKPPRLFYDLLTTGFIGDIIKTRNGNAV